MNEKEKQASVKKSNIGKGSGYSSQNYIVKDGKSEFTVVVSVDATAVEKNAASELVKYIEKVTGVKLPVTAYKDIKNVCNGGKYISIGNTVLSAIQNLKAENLHRDGFIIKTVNDTLFIVGNNGRGTLYGVYEFLEREAGVKFLSVTYEHIPKSADLLLRNIDICENPAFEFRTNYVNPTRYNEDYTAKMRFYSKFGFSKAQSDKIGGTYWDYFSGGYHSMYRFVPHEKYYTDHPDWFSGPDRKKSQPCYSSGISDEGILLEGESFARTLIENVTEYLLNNDNPELEYVILGQMDNNAVCRCSRCLAQIDKLGGSRSAQLIILVNTVAQEVKTGLQARGRNVDKLKFVATSYSWSSPSPTKVGPLGYRVAVSPAAVPRDDVYIYLAPIDACYMHAFNDPECGFNLHEFNYDIQNWRKLTDRIFIWDYECNFSEFLTWFPNIEALDKNIRYYRELGAKGVFAEGTIKSQNFYQSDLESWLLGKLLWNPDLSLWQLIHEYNRYYFGKAAGRIIDEYVHYVENHFREEAKRQGNNVRHAAVYTCGAPYIATLEVLNKVFLDKVMNYMAEAEKAIKNDTGLTKAEKKQYLFNLSQAKVQPMYMKFRNYDEVYDTSVEERAMFMSEFFELAESLDLEQVASQPCGQLGSIGKTVDDLREWADKNRK